MRWSSFQGKPLSKIDGEYQKMVADDLKQMMKSPPPMRGHNSYGGGI